MRYDRASKNLDRRPNYSFAAYIGLRNLGVLAALPIRGHLAALAGSFASQSKEGQP